MKKKHVIQVFFAIAFLVSLVFACGWGVPALHSFFQESSQVPETSPKPEEFSNLSAEIVINGMQGWQGSCNNATWRIVPIASGPGYVVTSEGNPIIDMPAITHNAPGAFMSGNGCALVKVRFNQAGSAVFSIYTRP